MRKLKLFFACLLMAVLSIGQVWADEVTFNYADYKTKGGPSGTGSDYTMADKTDVSIGDTKFYGNNSYAHFYANGTLTVTPSTGVTISEVKFTVESSYNGYQSGTTISASAGTLTKTSNTLVTWTGSATSAFTISHNKQIRWTSIVVTYSKDAGTKTLTSIAVSGTPAKTAYYAGDNFDPAGLTVTGTYSDASTAPITSGITWSYDPSQELALNQTSIGVIATVSEKVSPKFNVTGLTVSAASPKITITQDEVADFTNTYAEYTWTAGGVSGKMYAYKNAGMQFNSSKTGYYVYNTDAIPGRITKITMTKASGTDRSWTPYVSTTAMTAPIAEKALDAQTVTSTGVSWDVTGSNSYFYLTVAGGSTVIGSIVIEYTEDAPPAIDAPSISGDVNFVGSTTVTISHDDADHIYYTTNGVDPTTSSTEYTAPFVVNADGTTTVKAIAVKGSDVSEVASKGFTKVTALESLAALLDATVSAETAFNVVIDNWVVTGVQGTRAWIADAANEKGILLYKSGHNFTAGNKLNGVVIGTKTKLYQGYPEMTTLVSTDVTVTTAEAVTPRTTTIAALTSGYYNEQGTVVKLENVTYTSSALSDGVNSIAADNKLFSSLALVEGTTYDITGVVEYLDGSVVKIMPRSIDDVVAKSAVVTPTAANLAALKAADRGTYILTLENAVVTYVNGNNAFIEDATGGALIYFASHGYSAGDCLNGDYQVTTTDYQGKFEITAVEPQVGAATTTAEIPLTTVTITALNANFGSYESRRVKIVGANVTDAIKNTDRNGAINDGAALAVYAAVASTITLNADDNVDIIGYPGFHNTDQQLNVWRQEDITVNVKEDPELAYNPTVVNVLLSDLASFTPADLEYATGFDGLAAITYESSDPSIATVETDGTVTLVATAEGSTTITASFAGNATYKADIASYTINVSAAPIAPVYTISFDMTRASYDDAADAQVVWNSSVVTMTANKNSGTKVTNYLAGNYSGTTLITETRFYTGNSISFVPQEGVTITKIEWMSTAKGYATKLAAETFVNATAAVDGTDDKLVIITPSAAGEISVTLTDAARATNVKVYYEAESEKAKLTASISIDDMNMTVGDDDILLSAIAATSNPNKKAISYAVTSGTAVTIEGTGAEAALHAAAEGSATITATIPNDLGNYTGATETFDIIVAAAPATLVSIAISGTATALEYTEGQDFNPAGLKVMGHYSDNSDAEITEGITWAFDPSPLTAGTTSVSVTATVSEISSSAFEVNGLTVSAAAAPTTDNVVILAVYDEKYYAMSTNNASSAFTAIAVEYDGSKVTVKSEAEKTAIQWTRTTNGDNTTFQDADDKYMKGTSSGAAMSLDANVCNWSWDGTNGYYYIGGRSFFYQNAGGVFKNYSISTNMGQSGYSDKAQVIVIDPENIVITSKANPQLAYNPDELEIAAEDVASWVAPVLGYVEGFDGVAAIEYSSDDESVATVTEGGEIALAGGYGTAVITATFGGNGNYLAGSATYTITVNAPAPVPTSTTYHKVTATEEITDGEYLIVYESTSVAFNGALETLDAEGNSVAVVINEDVIAGTTAIDAAVFTIDVTAGTLQSASGKYIGVSSNSNGLKQTEDASLYTHTFSIDEGGNAVIFADFEESTMKLRYNPSTSAGNLRFRYYKNDGQQAIQLYKKDVVTPPTPDYGSYQRNVTNGNYGTICLPKAGVISGATLFEIANYENDIIYVDEILNGEMEAGVPYIFQATSDQLNVVYSSAAEETAGNHNGLYGSYTEELLTPNAGNYILYQNQYWLVNSEAYVGANRAYIKLSQINNTGAQAPGRRRVAMTVHSEQTTTGIDALNAAEAPVKVLINGQMYILRGEKMYNVNGQVVK